MQASANTQNLIPEDAYLFFPSENEIKNTAGVRLIFDGNTKFTDYETSMVSQFKTYAQKHNYVLKPMWVDNMIVRFLQANGFKMDKTLTSIKEHTIWKESRPTVELTEPVRNFLEKGFLYVHGRDHKFRPIVVFSAYLLSAKSFDIDLMIEALTFFFGYMIENLLLPGQVENWIFITDLKGMGISSIPFDPIKKLLGFLQHNYRGRLYRMYIVNAPSSVYVPWQMAKKFLQEATVKKIQFYKQQVPEPLFEHANRDQVEKKYGGNAPDLKLYWPLEVPSSNYFLNRDEAKCLVSKEQYRSYHTKGQLKGHKLNMAIIDEDKTIQPIQIPAQTPRRVAGTKDLTADQTSCESSAIKSKRQSEAPPTPEYVSKTEVLGVPLEKSCLAAVPVYVDECQYTESMEENNNIFIRIQRVREFRAYFLARLNE